MRMVLFAISSKLIFTHFIHHTLLFIIPSSFPSYFFSITFITTHSCFSFPFASMFSIHSFHPFPFHASSHPLPSHSLFSIPIPILSFYSISSFPYISYFSFDSSFSHVQWYPALHYQVFILFSLILTLFIDSYNSSFLFNGTDIIHLISSLLTLITSLYLLSFSINLDSILCSMYYDLSISYPYLSLITPLSFYSISFYSYSYPFSSMPIHFIGSHSSIRHRTQLLISIHSHLNTPYPLPSCILSLFYSSIHTPLHPPSLLYSILIHPLIILPIHSFPHHPLSSILFSSHPSSYSILIPLSFPLLPLSSTNTLFYSILYFYSPLCSHTSFYSNSTPLTASPHPSLYHYPLPHSFAHTPFYSFSSL